MATPGVKKVGRVRFKTIQFDDLKMQQLQDNVADALRQIDEAAVRGPAGAPGAKGAAGSGSSGSSACCLPGFDPASIADPLARYSADVGVYSDAGVTLAVNGDAVYQWNDQWANALHFTQATAGKRPDYFDPPSGSRMPKLVWTDENRYLQRANDTGMTPASISVFAAVHSAAESDHFRNIYSQYHQPTDKGLSLGIDDTQAAVPRATVDGNNIIKNAAHHINQDVSVVGVTWDGTTKIRTLWLDGKIIAVDAVAAPLTWNGGTPTIGWLGYLGGQYGWVGDFYELLLYSRKLTTDEGTDVSGYLTRWNAFSQGAP